MSPPRDSRTLDLFAWQPTPPVIRHAEEIRAASLGARVSKAVSLAMKESSRTRDEIAEAMGAYLGRPVSKAMLDAWASESRDSHNISTVNLVALIQATGDHRLLGMLADLFGLAVIPERYVGAVEEALANDKIRELEERAKLARRRWKGGA